MIQFLNLNKINKKYEAQFEIEFQKFLKEGYYVLGDSVKDFENSFAKYCPH